MLARTLGPIHRALPIAASILTLLTAGCAGIPEAQKGAQAPESAVLVEPAGEATPAPTEPAPAPKSIAQTRNETPKRTTNSEVELKPSAPEQYVVVKGDTLWDISSKFLQEPWYWPEIWHVNPQVKNPHLIYPGDVLTVYYVGGKPRIQVTGGPRVGIETTRVTPQVRVESLDETDLTVPVQAIQQFISRPRVVTKEELERAPYIVGSQDNRLIYGTRDNVYVSHLDSSTTSTRYNVLRPGVPLRDPDTRELLGYEAILVADAKVVKDGEPATVQLTRAEREALIGDRLLPYDQDEDRSFFPRAPSKEVDGTIISLFDALSQIGALQIAVLNLGTRNGLEKGHVLAAYEAGRVVKDPYARNRKITLPDEKNGVMMVFRTFDKVSYALVMDATRPIHIGDAVRTP